MHIRHGGDRLNCVETCHWQIEESFRDCVVAVEGCSGSGKLYINGKANNDGMSAHGVLFKRGEHAPIMAAS